MKKLFVFILLVSPFLVSAQKIVKKGGDYFFYDFYNDDDVESDYDSIYKVAKDWYSAIHPDGNVHFFYHNYKLKDKALKIENSSLHYLWAEDDVIYASNTLGDVYYWDKTWHKVNDYFGVVVTKKYKKNSYALFDGRNNLTGYNFHKVNRVSLKGQPELLICESDSGFHFYSKEGKLIYPHVASRYTIEGNQYHEGKERIVMWFEDGTNGIFSPDKEIYILPNKFFKPFHSIYSSLDDLNIASPNSDVWMKLASMADDYEGGYYFPFERWTELPYYPIVDKESNKVGLIDLKGEQKLGFEYDQIFVYQVPDQLMHFIVTNKGGQFEILNSDLEVDMMLDIDEWVSFGYAYGYSSSDTKAWLRKGDEYYMWDVITKEKAELNEKYNGYMRAIQNHDGEFALFDEYSGIMMKPFEPRIIYDKFGYMYPEFEDDKVKFYNNKNEAVYPYAVTAVIPSYTPGMYLAIDGDKAGLFSNIDLSFVPLSESFKKLNDFNIDGGAANRRLDVSYLIECNGKVGVINYRNDTLLQPIYDSAMYSWYYEDYKNYNPENYKYMNEIGWIGSDCYITNKSHDKTLMVKKGKPVAMNADSYIFLNKKKFIVYDKATLSVTKDYNFGGEKKESVIIRDFGNPKMSGLVNPEGEIVIPLSDTYIWKREEDYDNFKYFQITKFDGDDSYEGIYSISGKELIAPKYQSVYNMYQKEFRYFFLVKDENKMYGIIKVDPDTEQATWIVDISLTDYRYDRKTGKMNITYANGEKAVLKPDGSIEK
ncbi:WG repeat-containing protein [Paracrocinitomix mangrovi]|uniref:WG repeat-containing protein n=1 Tax=Paracrocinitomix mangrovi TaxID=2862509 RepID=UPI001C8D6DCC|nr:WG repeat-containing protein [Paracrocinitomix mangrovi]UKN02957.1 WG repeat-containing protein [Paracrocinitomix mangrovi]